MIHKEIKKLKIQKNTGRNFNLWV